MLRLILTVVLFSSALYAADEKEELEVQQKPQEPGKVEPAKTDSAGPEAAVTDSSADSTLKAPKSAKSDTSKKQAAKKPEKEKEKEKENDGPVIPDKPATFTIFAGAGLRNATGLGAEIQLLLPSRYAIVAGGGIIFDGFRATLGSRYYWPIEGGVEPVVEFLASWNSGVDRSPEMTINEELIRYEYDPGFNLNTGAGIRWNLFSWFSMQWMAGLFVPISKDYKILSGPDNSNEGLNKYKKWGFYLSGQAGIGI